MDHFFYQMDKMMEDIAHQAFSDFNLAPGFSDYPRYRSPRDEMLRDSQEPRAIVPADEGAGQISPFSFFGRANPFNSRRDIVLDDYGRNSSDLFAGMFPSMSRFDDLENQPGVKMWSHSYSKSQVIGPGKHESMTERRRQRNPDGTIVEAQIDRVNGKEKGRFHKRQPDGKDDTHEYEAEYPYGGSAVKQSPLQIEGPDGAESGGRRWWQRGT